MNPTTDPSLKSFIDVPPTGPGADFPIQNLPYGVIQRADHDDPHVAVAIGDYALDLAKLVDARLLQQVRGRNNNEPPNAYPSVFHRPSLNAFMDLPPEDWHAVRARVSELLRHDHPELRDNKKLREQALVPMSRVKLLLPVEIGNYTDFYSSKEHATNVGIMFRGKENALMPNYLHLPVGYHGRASSVVVSGTDLHRPMGQTKADDAAAPVFGPSRLVDFELEMGFFIGNGGNALGERVPIDQAQRYIFGMVLVNDWSARDIQKWEYQPLGPFLAKNFGTTISPWVAPMEALEPFRCAAPKQEPTVLDYLREAHAERGAIDIHLEVSLQSEKTSAPAVISRSNFKYLYWTMAQQLAHHTVTGCNLRTGDLVASGTISGPTPDSYGSMLELSWRGEKPIKLPGGEERKFLQDGDIVTMRGFCSGKGYRLGFGECAGRILGSKK